MNKILPVILAISALILACSSGYYLLKYVPERDSVKVQEAKEKEMREIKLRQQMFSARAKCLDSAYKTYSSDWNAECVRLGLGNGCALPDHSSNYINKYHEQAKLDCFKMFPN